MIQPFWSKPRFVFSAIVLYLLAHFAIRMAMGHALSVDDSDQALFSQFYAWTYRYKAPPLFAWLLATLSIVIPPGAFSISLLRYSLLGILYVFIYLTARRLIVDPRLSALATYSFGAINTFAEASHRNLLHTTALAALLALAWYCLVRLAAAPRLGWYLALGAVSGLGLLAKWNFALFLLAVPLACLLRREGRPLLLNWRVLPAALLAAAIVAPTVIATLRMGPLPGEDFDTVLNTGAGSGPVQILEGTLRLAEGALIYSLPLLPIVLILFGMPLWRGLRAGEPVGVRLHRELPASFVGLTMATGLAILWALALFVGATEFKVRYLYPVLLILPVWLLMVIEDGRPSARAVNLFAAVMLALTVGIAAERVARQLTGELSCGLCLEMRPYPALAGRLQDAGYRGLGTIVSGGDVAGNLRVVFPDAHVVSPEYPTRLHPAGHGQCLIVWPADSEAPSPMPDAYAAYLAGPLHADPNVAHQDGLVSAPMIAPASGVFRLAYRLYAEPAGDCR